MERNPQVRHVRPSHRREVREEKKARLHLGAGAHSPDPREVTAQCVGSRGVGVPGGAGRDGWWVADEGRVGGG